MDVARLVQSVQAASIPAVYRAQTGTDRPADRTVAAGFFWPRTGRSPAAALLTDAYRLQSSAGRLTGETADAVGTPDGILMEAKSFVNAFNALTGRLEQGARSLSGDLLERLRQVYQRQQAPLAEVGISAGPDGKLTVDATVFTEAIRQDPERVRQLFQSTAGLPLAASGVAEQVTYRVASALAAPPPRPRPTWTYSRLEALAFTGGQESLKGNLLDLVI